MNAQKSVAQQPSGIPPYRAVFGKCSKCRRTFRRYESVWPKGSGQFLCQTCHLNDAIPEIVITKHAGAWCYIIGSHYTSTGFWDTADPMDVAKFINSKTAGPVNVVIL